MFREVGKQVWASDFIWSRLGLRFHRFHCLLAIECIRVVKCQMGKASDQKVYYKVNQLPGISKTKEGGRAYEGRE